MEKIHRLTIEEYGNKNFFKHLNLKKTRALIRTLLCFLLVIFQISCGKLDCKNLNQKFYSYDEAISFVKSSDFKI